MATQPDDTLAAALFSEILTVDQLARSRLSRALPKGMELSHFVVLNHLARAGERSPTQLAQSFDVTRGAMTNTLGRLEWAGFVHIRPDWNDARRKMVAISPAGKTARNAALSGVTPLIAEIVGQVGAEKVRDVLPILRELRERLRED